MAYHRYEILAHQKGTGKPTIAWIVIASSKQAAVNHVFKKGSGKYHPAMQVRVLDENVPAPVAIEENNPHTKSVDAWGLAVGPV